MKRVRTVVKTVVTVIVALAIIVSGIDFCLRGTVKPKVNVEAIDGDLIVPEGTLIVYLPGVLAHARDSAGPLVEVWREYGDVRLVEYGDGRFDADAVVQSTVDAVVRAIVSAPISGKPYDQLILIGSSMGGPLAVDVAEALADVEGVDIPLPDLVLLDAPASGKDLLNSAAPLASMLYTGPWFDKLGLTRFLAGEPKPENLEPGVDRSELSRRVKVAQSFATGFFADEVRYMLSRRGYADGELSGKFRTVTYVRCTLANDVIAEGAVDGWSAAYPDIDVIEVRSTHVGYAEWPNLWEDTFDRILRSLVTNK